MKIVECVPNFSEGRDRNKIRAIVREIESTPGVKLLDVDPGESTNRTVVTFIGTPEAVEEAAFKAIRKAAEVIDMRVHKGAHSRIGATDVCPFVPVSGVTMEDCVRLAHDLGSRVAGELGIPVYLYEEAALRPERRNLADIRAGEYEGLAEKLKDPAWAPDRGAPVFNPRSGATVIGAREFLIAYNINLNTRDRKLAHEIALNLRESGRAKRDKDGNILRDEEGQRRQGPRQVQRRQVRRLVHRGLRRRPDLDQLHELQGLPGPRRLRRDRPRGRGPRPPGDRERARRAHPEGGPAHGRAPLPRKAGQEPRRPRSGAHPDGRPVPRAERQVARSTRTEEDHREPVQGDRAHARPASTCGRSPTSVHGLPRARRAAVSPPCAGPSRPPSPRWSPT